MKYKLQEKGFSCGPAAIRNCLLKLGKNVTESYIRQLAHTTSNGTTEEDLFVAIESLGFTYKEYQTKSPQVFSKRLLKALKNGNPCIIATDSYFHWVAAIQYSKRKVKIIDSVFKESQKSYIQNLSTHVLKKMCLCFDRISLKSSYYLIEIKKAVD